MSNKDDFDGKWLFTLAATILGFPLGTSLIRILPSFYYYFTLTLFALFFGGLCSKIYEKVVKDE